jgi:hypothetical protein
MAENKRKNNRLQSLHVVTLQGLNKLHLKLLYAREWHCAYNANNLSSDRIYPHMRKLSLTPRIVA